MFPNDSILKYIVQWPSSWF